MLLPNKKETRTKTLGTPLKFELSLGPPRGCTSIRNEFVFTAQSHSRLSRIRDRLAPTRIHGTVAVAAQSHPRHSRRTRDAVVVVPTTQDHVAPANPKS